MISLLSYCILTGGSFPSFPHQSALAVIVCKRWSDAYWLLFFQHAHSTNAAMHMGWLSAWTAIKLSTGQYLARVYQVLCCSLSCSWRTDVELTVGIWWWPKCYIECLGLCTLALAKYFLLQTVEIFEMKEARPWHAYYLNFMFGLRDLLKYFHIKYT